MEENRKKIIYRGWNGAAIWLLFILLMCMQVTLLVSCVQQHRTQKTVEKLRIQVLIAEQKLDGIEKKVYKNGPKK